MTIHNDWSLLTYIHSGLTFDTSHVHIRNSTWSPVHLHYSWCFFRPCETFPTMSFLCRNIFIIGCHLFTFSSSIIYMETELCFFSNFYICIFFAAAQPQWIEKINDTQLDSGEQLRWECKASGKPRPIYRWLKNGLPLLPQVPRSSINYIFGHFFVTPDKTFILLTVALFPLDGFLWKHPKSEIQFCSCVWIPLLISKWPLIIISIYCSVKLFSYIILIYYSGNYWKIAWKCKR